MEPVQLPSRQCCVGGGSSGSCGLRFFLALVSFAAVVAALVMPVVLAVAPAFQMSEEPVAVVVMGAPVATAWLPSVVPETPFVASSSVRAASPLLYGPPLRHYGPL